MSTRRRASRGSWQRYHGVTADAMAAILAALPEALGGEALTREELIDRVVKLTRRDDVAEPLAHSWGAVLKPAADKGLLCFGPPRGRNVTFVSARAWLGEQEPVDPEEAVAALARAHLDAYGPADATEFSRWFGVDPPVAKRAYTVTSRAPGPASVVVIGSTSRSNRSPHCATASAPGSRTLRPRPPGPAVRRAGT
jgi:hypothetical protein